MCRNDPGLAWTEGRVNNVDVVAEHSQWMEDSFPRVDIYQER
jgi:hypothetical protein